MDKLYSPCGNQDAIIDPGFHHHTDYLNLTPTMFLGAVEFWYAAQRWPECLKITVSNETGCIVLIIWARHILEMTVVISG
jgi:hypothetical protein